MKKSKFLFFFKYFFVHSNVENSLTTNQVNTTSVLMENLILLDSILN